MLTRTEVLGNRRFNAWVLDVIVHYETRYPAEAGGLERLRTQATGGQDLRGRHNFQGHVTASALVWNTRRRAMLTVWNQALGKWLQPGGHCEPGEHPFACAQRELAEEVGLVDVIVHPWHDAHPLPFDLNTHPIPANSAKGEDGHWHHDFRYLFASIADIDDLGSMSLQTDEISSVRWSTASMPDLAKGPRRIIAKIDRYLAGDAA